MSSAPSIVTVAPGSPAQSAGLLPGDVILSVNGEAPRDIIAYQHLIDEPHIEFIVSRGGLETTITISREDETPLGIEIHSPVFDRIRTCDNHCEFCFIYQLPKDMRRSLYVKDDDYRLSFLYGNFTTLTRFTEADVARVIDERLSPLYVSIHTTDPMRRAEMLRNPRGATSLRWLRALLDHGITIHGQIVVCPGINDGEVLNDTLAGILDEYPEIATIAAVPLGVSRFTTEARMRPHTQHEAEVVVDLVEMWQAVFLRTLGRRLVYAADEYYLMTDRVFPDAEIYGDFAMHEDGIGLARAFIDEVRGESFPNTTSSNGFFQSIDAPAFGYRAARVDETAAQPLTLSPRRDRPTAIVTGTFGSRVITPLLDELQAISHAPLRVLTVPNDFFGGNIGVTGLLTGSDIARTLEREPDDHRYLLPDVCLNGGRFLDDVSPADLPRNVDVIASTGRALRHAISPEYRRTA